MIKFDNIAPVSPERREEARAALQQLESFENGTAIDFIPFDRGGTCVKVGDEVYYKSISGVAYNAVLTDIMFEGEEVVVAVDVIIPGCDKPLHLTKIKYRAESNK